MPSSAISLAQYCRCADVFRKVSELALDVDDERRQVIVRLFDARRNVALFSCARRSLDQAASRLGLGALACEHLLNRYAADRDQVNAT